MTQPNNDFFNADYEDARQWESLFKHEYFIKVETKLNNDIATCDKNIQSLSQVGSLDSSIKIAIEAATKERLKNLLRYFDFQRSKKLSLDQELTKRKAINASV